MGRTQWGMRRRAAVAAGVALVAALAGPAVTGEPAGAEGGADQWDSRGEDGSVVLSELVLSPDDATVVLVGSTNSWPARRIATVAHAADTGRRLWSRTFPATDDRRGRWQGAAQAVAMSPDGATVVVSGIENCFDDSCGPDPVEGPVTIAYDVATGGELWSARLDTWGGVVNELAVSPDGTTVFLNAMLAGEYEVNRHTVAYELATGAERWRSQARASSHDGDAVLSPDGDSLVVVDTDRAPGTADCTGAESLPRITLLDTADGAVTWSTSRTGPGAAGCGARPTSAALSPDGATVVVAGLARPEDDSSQSGEAVETLALDAATGDELWVRRDPGMRTVRGHEVGLVVAPDGDQVTVSAAACLPAPEGCERTAAVTTALAASDGAERWRSRYDSGGTFWAGELVSSPDGAGLYLSGDEHVPCPSTCRTWTGGGVVVALDPASGAMRWVRNRPGVSGQAMAVTRDGTSLFLSGAAAEGAASVVRLGTGPGPGTVNDTDAAVTIGGWRGSFHSTASAGGFRSAAHRGARAAVRTPATRSVTWLTRVGPDQGRARVLVDGRLARVVDLHARTPGPREVTITGLARARHEVVVEVLGRRSATSRGTWVAVDGFRLGAGGGIDQETSRAVRYDGWRAAASSASLGGVHRSTGTAGSRVSFGFTGRSVRWITAVGPTAGRARVTVDGRSRVVDLRRRTAWSRAVVPVTGLRPGRHRITVQVLAPRAASPRASTVVVDAFVVGR